MVLSALDAESAIASAWRMLQLQLAAVLVDASITAASFMIFQANNLDELLLLLCRRPVARHQQHLGTHVQQQLSM
jgi:hypothetical protein